MQTKLSGNILSLETTLCDDLKRMVHQKKISFIKSN